MPCRKDYFCLSKADSTRNFEGGPGRLIPFLRCCLDPSPGVEVGVGGVGIVVGALRVNDLAQPHIGKL